MATRNFVYVPGAVNGSTAYDFSHPGLYREEYSQTLEKPKAVPKVRTKAVPRTRQSVAPTAVIGAVIAAVALVCVMMANAQLMEVSVKSAALESQLADCTVQQAKLMVQYESAFNLSEIEQYATTTLGMQKANTDQIVYLDTSPQDKAVIMQDAGADSMFNRVADFISSIGGLIK